MSTALLKETPQGLTLDRLEVNDYFRQFKESFVFTIILLLVCAALAGFIIYQLLVA